MNADRSNRHELKIEKVVMRLLFYSIYASLAFSTVRHIIGWKDLFKSHKHKVTFYVQFCDRNVAQWTVMCHNIWRPFLCPMKRWVRKDGLLCDGEFQRTSNLMDGLFGVESDPVQITFKCDLTDILI